MNSILHACIEAFSGPCDVSGWLLTAGLGLLVLVSLYVYSTWTYNFFKAQGIPGPRPLPFIGNMIDLFITDPTKWQTDYARKYGKVYGMFSGRTPTLIVSDPELIKDVTVKLFRCFTNRALTTTFSEKPFCLFLTNLVDDHWRHVRAALSPVFTSGKLKEMEGTIIDCADRLATHISNHDGEEMIVNDIMGAYTMDAIAGIAFGLDVRCCEDLENPFLKHAKSLFVIINSQRLTLRILIAIASVFTSVCKALAKVGLRVLDKKCVTYFDKVVEPLLKDSNFKEGKRNFVQLCRDQLVEIDKVDKDSLRSTDNVTWTTEGLLADEVTANAIIFIFGGYETTSTLLTFFLYAMAANPRVQDKLYNELSNSLGETASPTYENVKSLKYLDWCINEALRMYPPVPRIDRVCSTATQVGHVNVPAGTRIIIPFYAIHHDPTYWPEPDVFRPERFSPEECGNRPTSVHVPFGLGPRICIGMRLAQLQAKVAIAKIISTYAVLPGKGFLNAPVKWRKVFFLLAPADRIKLRFIKRHH